MKYYHFFWGGPFSNWCPAKITYKGHEFANSEQAFMWEKAMAFNDTEIANQMLLTTDPRKVKKLGRKVKNFDNDVWEDVRFDIMYNVCLAKFEQNEDLQRELFSHANFVEASPEDAIWGIGMAEGTEGIEDPSNWLGFNLLGQVLDKVRTQLINQLTDDR